MTTEPPTTYQSPPYTGPLREIAPPNGSSVRVQFACPHCGQVLERDARLEETRWYVPSCGLGHSGVGVQDPSVQRVKAY
jgi:predicted RNA-binding Zn-ribbon protein involved in translation (DUF1610 family)